ncbi:unnamed protein product [Brassica rapa]|uniref:Uncharacterized protein n=2 Tax=Brassica TaxID=3705 RepID=A0A8D9HIH6_BRACM|nr:unnamed protein product [Brassica napus]CAG7899582.1 unnamed protein product [Brassica rapa]
MEHVPGSQPAWCLESFAMEMASGRTSGCITIGSSQKNIGVGHFSWWGGRTVRRPFGNVRRYGFGKRHRLKEPTLESDEKPETTSVRLSSQKSP